MKFMNPIEESVSADGHGHINLHNADNNKNGFCDKLQSSNLINCDEFVMLRFKCGTKSLFKRQSSVNTSQFWWSYFKIAIIINSTNGKYHFKRADYLSFTNGAAMHVNEPHFLLLKDRLEYSPFENIVQL